MALPISLADLLPDRAVFRTQEEVLEPIRAACTRHADLASFHMLGASEEGRPIYGVVIGKGRRTVSLLAGNHADEPVGPETLRTFILEGLGNASLRPLFEDFRFVLVPHTNPDGEAQNRSWMEQWPSLDAYLRQVHRELPGRDVEFGFPSMRQENRLVAAFLQAYAPYQMHMSLHGMAFSEGAMLLIERHWAGARSEVLRERFAALVAGAGLHLHDHNRKGEKGFFYIEPGFTTTPEGAAMRAHFKALGDEQMAARFHDSSMEYVRSLGGDPLCLVTELPLFIVERARPVSAGQPATYLAFQERLPEIRLRMQHGDTLDAAMPDFQIHPLRLDTALRLHLQTIQLGLETLSESLPAEGESGDVR